MQIIVLGLKNEFFNERHDHLSTHRVIMHMCAQTNTHTLYTDIHVADRQGQYHPSEAFITDFSSIQIAASGCREGKERESIYGCNQIITTLFM